MNKVILFGRLGKDPEEMKGNVPGCRFSLATSETYKDKQSGERKERTEWHNLQAWGSTAKFVLANVKKGMRVLIEGKITHNEYQGKTYTNIVVKEVFPVWDSKNTQPADQPAAKPSGSQEPGFDPDKPHDETDIPDDDIPF